jgi:hypothetical protein
LEGFILEDRDESDLDFLFAPQINFGLNLFEELCKVEHEEILFFEFGSESNNLPGGVINTHEDGPTFGVEEGDNSFEDDPFGLLVLDGKVVFFVLDVDAFGREGLAEFEIAFAVNAVGKCLLHDVKITW